MSSHVLSSFLGALQASLAVLLTISYGVIASRFNLLKESSSRDISKACVRLFLPALLITNVGSELHVDTALRYVPVLTWAFIYTLSSMGLGWLLKTVFKYPAWTVPAICFNNTTALPLLLIQSLEESGILEDLTMGTGDTSAAAATRAKSYFLVSAMVGNSLTFAVGPKLLDDEETPEKWHEERQKKCGRQSRETDEEQANIARAEEQEEHVNETTTLLPSRVAQRIGWIRQTVKDASETYWLRTPLFIRKTSGVAINFLNAPLLGAIIGGILGLAPPLHKAFFNEPSDGGIFKAWLTASLSNVGKLFPALQLVVVGSKLSGSLLKIKKGEACGTIKPGPMLSIFLIRFIIWPIMSIGAIYFVVSKTNWLDDDPMLWFVLMLMPTGPPATKLCALADVSGADDEERMSIVKVVAISYALSPIICFAVVGSLKASLSIKS